MKNSFLLDLDNATRIPAVETGTLDPFRLPYLIAAHAPHRAANVRMMTTEILRWTGWSDRSLAAFVGTTHPSIATVRGGRTQRPGTRNTDYVPALRTLHAVAARIYQLAQRDHERTAAALRATGGTGSVRDLIAAGRGGEAYLLALDQLRPDREGGMLIGTRAASPRGRTRALDVD